MRFLFEVIFGRKMVYFTNYNQGNFPMEKIHAKSFLCKCFQIILLFGDQNLL